LVHAADELFHFLIVFLAIFIGFVISGHILFGDDLVEFSTFSRAMNTAYAALLGDFGWYTEQSVSDKDLGSGLPQYMLALWFWLYSSFVVLVILNMLLAIIMDHYTELVVQVRQSASDAPTIWKQTANYINRRRTTKGFISHERLLCEMTDASRPAHEEDSVTHDSLLAAFPNMREEQRNFIINWLGGWAREKALKEGDEENIARLKEISALMSAMSNQIHVVSLTSNLLTQRMNDVSSNVATRFQTIEESMASCATKMTELETLLQKGGSTWARCTPRSLRETAPLLVLGDGAAANGRPPSDRLPGVPTGQSQGQGAVAETKLVADSPTRPKREKSELVPCCAPAPSSAKSTILAERRW